MSPFPIALLALLVPWQNPPAHPKVRPMTTTVTVFVPDSAHGDYVNPVHVPVEAFDTSLGTLDAVRVRWTIDASSSGYFDVDLQGSCPLYWGPQPSTNWGPISCLVRSTWPVPVDLGFGRADLPWSPLGFAFYPPGGTVGFTPIFVHEVDLGPLVSNPLLLSYVSNPSGTFDLALEKYTTAPFLLFYGGDSCPNVGPWQATGGLDYGFGVRIDITYHWH
jgi:hypothetical protein